MFLNLPRQRIEITRTRMRSEGLPRGQCTPRGFHRAINIRCRSVRDRCEFFTRGRIGRVEISPRRGLLPGPVYEVSESPAVTDQPSQSVARILRRGAGLPGHEFFDDAHSLLPASLVIESGFSRLRDGMAIIRRVTSRGAVLQFRLDIRKHAAGAKPDYLR